ncbi:hypothetical protein V8C44DRAFT_113821 [Trichoderma aethiopicum]
MDKYMVMLCFPSVFPFFASSFTFYSVLSCLFSRLFGPLPKARPVAVAAGPQLFHHLLLFFSRPVWLHACLGGPPFQLVAVAGGMMDDYAFHRCHKIYETVMAHIDGERGYAKLTRCINGIHTWQCIIYSYVTKRLGSAYSETFSLLLLPCLLYYLVHRYCNRSRAKVFLVISVGNSCKLTACMQVYLWNGKPWLAALLGYRGLPGLRQSV